MISRREMVAATAMALAGRTAARSDASSVAAVAPAPGTLILRIVGAAAVRTKGTNSDHWFELSLPTHEHSPHDAFFVVENRHLVATQTKWKLPDGCTVDDPFPLRKYHLELGLDCHSYRKRPLREKPDDPTTLMDIGLTGNATVKDNISIARMPQLIAGLGKSFDPDTGKFTDKNFSQGCITLRGGGLLRSGPPSGRGLGDGMRWRLPRGWIFRSDPDTVLSDCMEFEVPHDGTLALNGPLADVIVSGDVIVWLINAVTEPALGGPNKLEHGKIYWHFFLKANPDKLPVPHLSADFPKPDETPATGAVTRRFVKQGGVERDISRWLDQPLEPPTVELCYGASVDF